MAGLFEDKDKDKQDQGQGQQSGVPGFNSDNTGGGSFAGGAGTSFTPQQQQGTGGQQQWTNIQEYLNANQGQGRGAQMLNENIGGQFNKESQDLGKAQEQDLQNQWNTYNTPLQQYSESAGNLKKDYMNSGSLYQPYANFQGDYASMPNQQLYTSSPLWNRDQTQYNTDLANAQKAQTYNPFTFNQQVAPLSAQTQSYGALLKDDPSFSSYLSSIYTDANPSFGLGQRDLQRQLDLNSTNIGNTRQSLMDQYAGLQKQQTDVNQGLQNTAKGYQDTANQEIAGINKNYGDFNTAKTNLENYANFANFGGGPSGSQAWGVAPVDYGNPNHINAMNLQDAYKNSVRGLQNYYPTGGGGSANSRQDVYNAYTEPGFENIVNSLYNKYGFNS